MGAGPRVRRGVAVPTNSRTSKLADGTMADAERIEAVKAAESIARGSVLSRGRGEDVAIALVRAERSDASVAGALADSGEKKTAQSSAPAAVETQEASYVESLSGLEPEEVRFLQKKDTEKDSTPSATTSPITTTQPKVDSGWPDVERI